MNAKISIPVSNVFQNFEGNYLVNRHAKNNNKKIPITTIAFFLFLQVCFGIDAGFSEIFKGRTRKFIKTISTLISAIISIILIYPLTLWSRDDIWILCTFFKYVLAVVCLRLKKYTLYNFVQDIHNLNEDIPAIDKKYYGIVIMVYTFTMYIVKDSLVTTRCIIGWYKHCKKRSIFSNLVLTAATLSTDTISGILITTKFYVYSYILCMKNSLNSNFDLNVFEKRYMVIAECCSKINLLFNHIAIIELFVNTPRLMLTLWHMLLYIKENAEWYSYTSELLFTFDLTIQMCIPSVIAEMINSQVDSIKLKLCEQRRLEKDEEKYKEITGILQYIKVRRLQNDIWRVIPVDLRLPLALLSLFTTYFIIILQFTHLYD